MDYATRRQAQRFLREVVVPALDEVREDLCARGLKATLDTSAVEAFGIDTAGLHLELDGNNLMAAGAKSLPTCRTTTRWT